MQYVINENDQKPIEADRFDFQAEGQVIVFYRKVGVVTHQVYALPVSALYSINMVGL